MRIVFVYYAYKDAGSAVDLEGYAAAARVLGHDLFLYGDETANPGMRIRFSRDLRGVDAAVFIFEWTTELCGGDQLDVLRILDAVPRGRRVVIDCDTNYNDPLRAGADFNHRDAAGSQSWMRICDAVADRICQPALRPQRANVRSFLFHGYAPELERPLSGAAKPYALTYVGHSKFRWGPMERLLDAYERLPLRCGGVAIVGHGWDAQPQWAARMAMEDCYFVDHDRLRRLGVVVFPPVPYSDVLGWMSQGQVSPVLYRPLFERLGFVTCRTFETPAADTIPLFVLPRDYVSRVYGESAVELVLDGPGPSEQLGDMLARPARYREVVREVRRHLRERHSYVARLQELIAIIRA